MKTLAGKVALVTGGASGIGHAAALALAQDGASVAVADVNIEGGEKAAAEIRAAGGTAKFFRADASVEADIVALIRDIAAAFGGLDCAHNNVGLGKPQQTVIGESEGDFDWTIRLCLKTTFLCMKHEIPEMLRAGAGAIVNTASMAGVIYAATASPSYSAAKAGVIQLSKYASNAYADQGVRINCISPGLVATPLISEMFSLQKQAEIAGAAQVIARAVTPAEIAEAVVFLCSARSAMVTGTNIEICGGIRH